MGRDHDWMGARGDVRGPHVGGVRQCRRASEPCGHAGVRGVERRLLESRPYIPAQIAGAFCGAILVWMYYLPHWAVTPEADLKLACFSTGPAIRQRGANLFSEAIGTFVLIVVIAAITSKAVGNLSPVGALSSGFGPYLVGMLVWSIGLSLGGTTGYAINPARDFGPRIAHAILPIRGKGGSDWGYAIVPILGPLLGGALAGCFVHQFIS